MTCSVSFSHVHLYVDRLEDLSSYKKLERQLNELWASRRSANSQDDEEMCSISESSATCRDQQRVTAESHDFMTQNRDVVRQMLAGFGFRITGARYPGLRDHIQTNSRSLLLTSRDPNGIQILVTAIDHRQDMVQNDGFFHFDAARVRTFYEEHNQRQGIAALAFFVDDLQSVHGRYKSLHPALVSHYQEYEEKRGQEIVTIKILEVFAFYRGGHSDGEVREADKGTTLRFMEIPNQHEQKHPPGLVILPATFDDSCLPAYSDHWVSNVINRTEFLQILNETLDFSAKVDFNAGVVAAGEAQIESTVTGNTSALSTTDYETTLRDQSQVYLPINNSLSEAGHVHLFLKEIGQGVQHVASRVQDLVAFVQQVNDHRRITGEGFTFLNIPRSYYGVLTLSDLAKEVSKGCAQEIWKILDQQRFLAEDGAVDLGLSRDILDTTISKYLCGSYQVEYVSNRDKVIQTISRSRHKNLYSLLQGHLNEEQYLAIVRNQILVDIQGEDLLYQIFTCKILQRKPSDEAPFFEFIQRVCSVCQEQGKGSPPKLRPGCGGFGIRNFLTLFLSIEVSKAMQEVANARANKDKAKQEYEQARVDCFTAQLNESNPILTEISDAMQDAGSLQERLLMEQSPEEQDNIQTQIREAEERKRSGSAKLMRVSAKFNDLMKTLRSRKP